MSEAADPATPPYPKEKSKKKRVVRISPPPALLVTDLQGAAAAPSPKGGSAWVSPPPLLPAVAQAGDSQDHGKSFQDLLGQIRAVHEAAVASLHQEIASLRLQLGASTGAASDGASGQLMPPPVPPPRLTTENGSCEELVPGVVDDLDLPGLNAPQYNSESAATAAAAAPTTMTSLRAPRFASEKGGEAGKRMKSPRPSVGSEAAKRMKSPRVSTGSTASKLGQETWSSEEHKEQLALKQRPRQSFELPGRRNIVKRGMKALFKRRIDFDTEASDSDEEEQEKNTRSESANAAGDDGKKSSSGGFGRRTSETGEARDLLPSVFKVYSGWEPGAVKVRGAHIRKGVRPSRMNTNMLQKEDGEEVEQRGGQEGFLQKFVWHPHSQRRLYWDFFGMGLLGHDLIMIPFKYAFEPENNLFFDFFVWAGMLFWTCDMLLSFLTGYAETHGNIVMLPSKIARRYLQTWFVLDIVLVGFDWLLLLVWDAGGESEDKQNATRLGRSLRTLRFLRSLRLLRLLKLKRIFQEIQDQIDSEVVSTYWGIFKITLLIITANHVIACMWYSIGMSTEGDPATLNWVQANGLDEMGVEYRYTTAMHWSLTQFTPASMEVYPYNAIERGFCIIVVLFAMVTFSSFVSTLTSNMTHLRNRTADETRQFWLLRRYLKDLNITKMTSLRVQRYLEFAYRRQQQRVQEKEVALLNLLSQPLRYEVKHESFAPHLFAHPLFMAIGEQTKAFTEALQAVSLANKDVCFETGQAATTMFFVVDGELFYSIPEEEEEEEDDETDDECDANSASCASDDQRRASREESSFSDFMRFSAMTDEEDVEESLCEEGLNSRVVEGQWITEAVLWTPWVHLGELQALTDSQLITVDADSFGSAVRNATSLWSVLHRYGLAFVTELNTIQRSDLTDNIERCFSPKHIIRKCAPRMSKVSQNPFDLAHDRSSGFSGAATTLWHAIVGKTESNGQRTGCEVTSIRSSCAGGRASFVVRDDG